jgi:hypothetical protein
MFRYFSFKHFINVKDIVEYIFPTKVSGRPVSEPVDVYVRMQECTEE